ncbi:heat shock factor protein isoform X3 [Culex pipiens pallens]|uniref:heat shock factor protein isoform X3 n=1 Tax=Culex pipiens pallens TaxID=42434 RepID=UPI0019549FDF|nr:heat shock factor protein isoform X3 [Culex pipiens pallens]
MHTFSETGAGVPAFLAKLWRLVEDPETNDLISWSTDGRSFIIQNQAQFAKELLPLNYKHNNMASFIRQLNMYGFHKITSIDNGGLRFDKDEMEFTHPCFQKDHPYLLEHIKRKIANSKQQQQQQQQQQQDDKSSTKVEAVNRVLSEMKNMRGRQDSLDSRFSTMKQENEALWREIAILRQKHMKQQQIVNKLIQFLVTIVQPSRGGLGSMNGNGNNKRRFQLMINDAPPTTPAKVKKTGGEGATIQELGEVLEEVAFENEQDLLSQSKNKKEKPTAGNGKVRSEKSKDSKESARTSEVPEVTSPISIAQQSPYRSDSVNEVIEEVTSPMSYYGGQQEQIAIKREHVDRTRRMTGPQEEEGGNVVDDGSYDDEGYLVDHVEEFEAGTSQLYNDSDMLVTPMVIKEMQKQEQLKQMQQQQQQQQQKAVSKGESLLKIKKNGAIHKAQKSLLTNNKHAESNSGKKMHHVGVGKTISSNEQSGTSAAGPSGMGNFVTDSIPTTSIGYGMNDFIVNDQVPSDLFDDNDSQMEKESPMLGVGFNFDGGFYNPNVNINEMKGRQQQLLQQQQQQQQQPQSQAAGPSHESNLQADDEDDLNGGDESDKAGRTLARFVSNDSDMNKLNTIIDYGHHIDTVQTDLDSLKDLLKGEGYQFDANTLLGLFAGNEDLLGYDFPMNLPDAASVTDAQKRNIAVGGAGGGAITAGVSSSNSASNGSGGLLESAGIAAGGDPTSQLMAYKNPGGNATTVTGDYIDLNELLNLEAGNEDENSILI